MIITQLIGGLGNQLFQYAFARHLAYQKKVPLKLDISAFETYKLHAYSLDAFNIQAEIATAAEVKAVKGSWLERRLRKKTVNETDIPFDARHFKCDANAYVMGYFQTEKYFSAIAGDLKKELTLKKPLSDQDQKVLSQIKSQNAVAVHIRRADYVQNSETLKVHGVCSPEYYEKALAMLAQNVPGMSLFVFSDDPAWVRENIHWPYPMTLVQHNRADRNYADLYLMSQCWHFVVANSSFSWWGAWLGNDPAKKVIAPKQWFQDSTRNSSDIVPESWIKI